METNRQTIIIIQEFTDRRRLATLLNDDDTRINSTFQNYYNSF